MNVGSTPGAIAIEKYKTEIIQYMIINPEPSNKQGVPDSVNITDIGKLLFDLSKAGSVGSREIIASIMAGRQDSNLENFLQAYCYVYGYDFSTATATYDRYGRGSRGNYYTALKKYLSTFGDYLLEEPDEDEIPMGFIKSIKKYLKRFARYLKS